MNFGLESYIPIVLYISAIACFLLTVFWKPLTGIIYLLPLIPLQTVRYRANNLPLGGSLIGIMLLGVAIGLLRQGRPLFPNTKWTRLIAIYALFTYVSLCLGATYLGQAFPFPGERRFGTWQEYMIMPVLLLLTAATTPTKRQMQAIIVVICLSILASDKSFWNTVSDRDFSTYSDDLHQEGGSMGYAGINGLSAFGAQAAAFLLALAAFDRRFWPRTAYYGLAFFSGICVMYSLSRGGYVAVLVGWLFVGIFKQRKLLIPLLLFLFTWTTIVPPAVRERVEMTYDSQTGSLDNSSNTRISLWSNAMDVFKDNMVLGTGFNTYEYMQLNKRTDSVAGYYKDTHNYFVKTLIETGIVGAAIFLWLLASLFGEGYSLFRHAHDPFFASLGLGLMAWLVCAIASSLFGDRWSFLQVNGFLWVIAALVLQARSLERNVLEPTIPAESQEEIATTVTQSRELSRVY
jgi:hypothetical protein